MYLEAFMTDSRVRWFKSNGFRHRLRLQHDHTRTLMIETQSVSETSVNLNHLLLLLFLMLLFPKMFTHQNSVCIPRFVNSSHMPIPSKLSRVHYFNKSRQHTRIYIYITKFRLVSYRPSSPFIDRNTNFFV